VSWLQNLSKISEGEQDKKNNFDNNDLTISEYEIKSVEPYKRDIDRAISEMKRRNELPILKKIQRGQQASMEQKYQKYKPNYSGIKRVFAINVIKLAKETHDDEYELGLLAGGGYLKKYVLEKELYLNILKEVILCDYERRDYVGK
jgi:hypothetical protein